MDARDKKTKKPKDNTSGLKFSSKYKYVVEYLHNPISIYDTSRRKYLYANQPFYKLTGFTEDEINKMEDKFFSLLHPDDLIKWQEEVRERLLKTYKQYIKHKNQRCVYSFNLRFRKKNGEYITLLLQCTVLEWINDFSHEITLNLFTDITSRNKDRKIVLNINVFNETTEEWETVLNHEFLNNPEMLSKREVEVMRLMARGNSATLISKSLGLSIHTTRAHWRNILLKTRCKSNEELKVLADFKGWI